MRAAFDEVLANGIKRQHPVQQIIGDLLRAEIAEKQARSIKYQITVSKLPWAKELADFDFNNTPVNETLVRDLSAGGFLAQGRSQNPPIPILCPKVHSASGSVASCVISKVLAILELYS